MVPNDIFSLKMRDRNRLSFNKGFSCGLVVATAFKYPYSEYLFLFQLILYCSINLVNFVQPFLNICILNLPRLDSSGMYCFLVHFSSSITNTSQLNDICQN